MDSSPSVHAPRDCSKIAVAIPTYCFNVREHRVATRD